MRGDLVLARKAALRWVFVLESRAAWLGDRGIPYVFGVAPCKSVGAGGVPAPRHRRRPRGGRSFSCCRRIAEDESPAEIVYPLEELSPSPRDRAIFSTHDSRWNANGAFVGYRRLLAAIPPSVDVRRLEREDIGFAVRPAHGDLGDRLTPPQQRDALLGRPHPRSARLVSDNRVDGEGRMLVTRCDAAPATTCIFFGEWSAYRMLTFLSESFRQMTFVHLRTLDHELVETERPDVVIGLADESGLIDLPADVEAPRAGELAERKLSGGIEPMPELAPLWSE